MSKRGTNEAHNEIERKRPKIDGKSAWDELLYLRKEVKKLRDKELKQHDELKEVCAKFKTSTLNYKAKARMELQALKKEKERYQDMVEYRKDVQQYNRNIDPCRSVCGYSATPIQVLNEKMTEARQLSSNFDWDFNILKNSPASNSEIYIPKLIPSDDDGRLFHWGMKDVFAVNINSRDGIDSVYRCTPLPKQQMRLRFKMVTYRKYKMNENEELAMKRPLRDRNWFTRHYIA
ncbi:unnamed protein product [Bursaphelenchus okinawaensis]|uniref:Uncharacterized protein n=1 Tax=Bursaphelenchus okinawaensis TaxID=465554 RepID=A0A811LNC4_9BILA|nr:unnamed protein product [Bursaphelenchus okinawaensis]CAG9126124.1 unnamed protein product [Bursaphelenchus okinawaensis]